MPVNKEAYIRYKIIDECLTNKFSRYPGIENLIDACEKKLGKNFSVSAIQKDIKAMKEDEALGFLAPIKYSRQHNGYYYTKPDYSINSIPLNSDELNSLVAFADLLAAFKESRISENFNNAVEKIHTAFREKKIHKGTRQKYIQTDIQRFLHGYDNFERTLHAIINKIPICFIHYSYKKRFYNSIIAHPVLLKEFQNKWYLVAWSEQHRQLRTFGLDRISDPLYLRSTFHHTSHEIIKNYFSAIYGVYPMPGFKLKKIYFFSTARMADYFKANPIHVSQKEHKTEEDGSMIFELELIPSRELINFFKQFSPEIYVIKPVKLVKTIQESLSTAFSQYRINHDEPETI